MKALQLSFVGIIATIVFLLISGCSKEESPVSPGSAVTTNGGTLAKPPSDFTNIARAINGNNGQGSIFLEPSVSGYGVYIEKDLVWELVELFPGFFINFPISGQIAYFSADFGSNDFWRQNPNGSVSVKLVSNQAYASVYDYGTGEYYEGTGHMNTKFTGSVDEFCYDPCIPDPCGFEWCVTNLTPDPNINAQVGTGAANVTDSQGGSHQLNMVFVQNPGGGGHVAFTLN
jgi:hypothetical protein